MDNQDKESYRQLKRAENGESKRSEAFRVYTFRKGETPEDRDARIAEFKRGNLPKKSGRIAKAKAPVNLRAAIKQKIGGRIADVSGSPSVADALDRLGEVEKIQKKVTKKKKELQADLQVAAATAQR